jgi:diacylglycerol kinase (ATP)
MNACLIFNPVARGDKARRFRDQIAALAGQCALKPTAGPGGGRPLAAQAVQEGFETIVAVGGDGTLNEVLNGIGDVPGGFAAVKLGLLPLGTVNVFAKELGLPMNALRAWEVVRAGRTRAVDVAVAEFTASGRPARRYFVQMAGAGMDSRAIELVDWEHKKRVGTLAYVIAALRAIAGPLPTITATVDGQTRAGQLVLVGNGRFYGGRYVLFPSANLSNGLLEVTVFPRVNWGVVIRCGFNVLTGQDPTAGRACYLRGRSVQLACPAPVPFHVEGENAGHLPVSCSILPSSLRVLVP